MKALDIIEETEGISQQALDEYAKLFGQDLCNQHMQALTALFEWSIPDEFASRDEYDWSSLFNGSFKIINLECSWPKFYGQARLFTFLG